MKDIRFFILLIGLFLLVRPLSQVASQTDESRRARAQEQLQILPTQVNERQQEAFERIKERLTTHIDRVINHLTNLKERIQKLDGLSETDKNTVIVQIDQQIVALQQLQTRVNDATAASELQSIGQELRQYWETIKIQRRKYVGIIIAARFSQHVERMEKIAVRVEAELEVLYYPGIDIVRVGLANFRQAAANAQNKIDQAQAIFIATTTSDTFNQGMQILKEAKQELRTAAQALKTAVQALESNP